MTDRKPLRKMVRDLLFGTPPPDEKPSLEELEESEDKEGLAPSEDKGVGVTLRLEDEVGYVKGEKREPKRRPIE